LQNALDVQPGTTIQARLSDGKLTATVTQVESVDDADA
jgi:hypothetical protein